MIDCFGSGLDFKLKIIPIQQCWSRKIVFDNEHTAPFCGLNDDESGTSVRLRPFIKPSWTSAAMRARFEKREIHDYGHLQLKQTPTLALQHDINYMELPRFRGHP